MKENWTIHGKHPPPDDVILDSMGLPLVVVDQQCRIIRVNTSAERLTGFYRSKLVGLSCADGLKASPCGPSCPVQQVLQSGATLRFDVVTLQTADMRTLSVEAITSPLLGPRGKVIGAVEILRELDGPEPMGVSPSSPWPARKAQQEMEAIREALEKAGGNITRAAGTLRMHRTTLWRKIRRYEIKL